MRKRINYLLPGAALLALVAARPAAAVPQNPWEAMAEAQDAVAGVLVDEAGSGWLGVAIAEVTSDKAHELKLPAVRGAFVTEVEADSPAAKSGLKVNDVITEFNGQHVEGTVQFRRMVHETPAGRTAQLTVWRDGRAQTLSVTLGSGREQLQRFAHVYNPKDFKFDFKMPELGGAFVMSRTPLLGIDAQDLSGQLGAYFGAPDGEGVLVTDVKSGTPAEKAGLKAGDVITTVDGDRVRTVGDLREKLHEKREAKTVALGVLRKGAALSLSVTIEQPKPPAGSKRLISHRITI